MIKVNRFWSILILEVSKILIYEFWFDYIKPKCYEKAELYYNDTESFVLNINTDYIFKDIAEYDETRFDTSNYELHRSLPKENIKSWLGYERLSRWKNNDKICFIRSKNVVIW